MAPRRSRRLTTAPLPFSIEADVCKKKVVSIDCLPDSVLLHVLASITPVKTAYARNSSADPTHSFSRDGSSLNNILQAVSSSLTSLSVTNCNDIFVGPAFDQLSTLCQLSRLHITSVRTRFNPNSFKSLRGLKHLKEITVAADNDFETVLSSDVLPQFPDSLLCLTPITSLKLSSKGIKELPTGIIALSNLQRLDLDGCKNLKCFPSYFYQLKSLRELSLNDTTGFMLMDSMKNLRLDKLSLRRAGVHSMPSGLENCFVKHLDASNNPCMSNVEVFARFPALSLQVLTLNDCDLNSIPDSVSRLTTLKVLEVANNGLMDVPETLSKLTNLECLNLEGNCFPKLPEVLPKLKMLCCLSLVACNYLEVHYPELAPMAKWPKLSAIWLWKTEGVKYQNYSQAALQQLKAKLQRKRRAIDLCYENTNSIRPLVMHGLTTSMPLSPSLQMM